MIVIKVELWPRGNGNKAREIGRTYIANTGTGTQKKGNYKVAVCRRGTKSCPWLGKNKPIREGSVEKFPRLSYNIWRLVIRSLKSTFPEEG